jgi:hypothetical protein
MTSDLIFNDFKNLHGLKEVFGKFRGVVKKPNTRAEHKGLAKKI